jgi:hypothetical protein
MKKPFWPLFLLLGMMLSLVSCVTSTRLPAGTTVHFHNAVKPEICLLKTDFKSFMGNNQHANLQVPELQAVMKRVVMEETGKAGLKCIYTTGPIQKTFQTPYAFMAMPWRGYQDEFYAVSRQLNGFTLEQTGSGLIGRRFRLGFAGRMLQFDQSKKSRDGIIFSTNLMGASYLLNVAVQDNRDWVTATASTRARAVRYWEYVFRAQVASVVGNPAPVMPPDIKKLATAYPIAGTL